VTREAYLSTFSFGEDFRALADSWGRLDVRGFTGDCGSAWLWWDIDRESDLERALTETRRFALSVIERFALDDEDVLLFYSGSNGFHVGMPTCLWNPAPSADFNLVARHFCEFIAERAKVTTDNGIYDKVRPFRARHPKTGQHKRRLTLDEMTGLSLERILTLAESPEPFDVPAPAERCEQAVADWLDAERGVRKQLEVKAQRRAENFGTSMLNRLTLDFIRNGASQGDRHRLLFSAAANLREFDCPPALAHALLTDSALDSGLKPSEARRQIDCGLAHVGIAQGTATGLAPVSSPGDLTTTDSTANTEAMPEADAKPLQAQLAALWASAPKESTDFESSPAVSNPLAAHLPDLPPMPPAGARLYYIDDRGRPCSQAEAVSWTWEGAASWYRSSKHLIPTGVPKGGGE
jgi:hypothetical protein